MFGKFLKDRSGHMALSVSILAIPLLGSVGLAVDYSIMHSAEAKLQKVADAAALASTKELALSTTSNDDAKAIAKAMVFTEYGVSAGDNTEIEVNTTINEDRSGTKVELAYYWSPFFAHVLDRDVLPLKISSSAERAGTEPMCVLAMNPSGQEKLEIKGKSSISANGCTVHVNSNDKDAIKINKSGTISALNIYTAGGYYGSKANFSPEPVVDSPTIVDPLSDRIAPKASGCDETNLVVSGGTKTLYPGTYCGGLFADSDSQLNMKPGVYIFKDGPVKLVGSSVLEGDHVTLFFEGDAAVFDAAPATTISLKAPKSGSTAGILIFEDRDATKGRTFAIRSKNAERLEGAIYLPNGTLFVDKESRVGQASKWSAIIAREFRVGDGPQIQINSNYAGSDVPVPEGIEGKAGQIRLTN